MGGPGSQAVVVADDGRELTHRRLRDRAARLASVFQARGLGAGGVIALLASDAVGVMEVLVAADHAGLVALPVDPSFSLEEAAYVVNDSGAAAVVIGDDFAPLAEPLAVLTPGIRVRWSLGLALEGHTALELARSAAVPRPRIEGDPGTLHYGGDSGRPTGRLVHADPGGMADVLSPGVVVLSTSSPADPMACRLRLAAVAHGGTVVSVARPTAARVVQAVTLHRPALLELAPRAAAELAQLGEEGWTALLGSTVRCVMVGPGCSADALARLGERWGPVVREYGATAPARDIERALASHPLVADVAVLPRKALLAIVEPVSGVMPGPDLERMLYAHVAETNLRLPEGSQIIFTSRLPRTASGAVDLRRLMPRDYL